MIAPEELERYGPLSKNLLKVKPGLTGLWQVRGRSELSYRDRAELDTRYIESRSLALDLKILFLWTLPAVLRGRGAY
jgi:lipopolysaccharide/colanic/teichoic acid biosynthesis glycosyltransferase